MHSNDCAGCTPRVEARDTRMTKKMTVNLAGRELNLIIVWSDSVANKEAINNKACHCSVTQAYLKRVKRLACIDSNTGYEPVMTLNNGHLLS